MLATNKKHVLIVEDDEVVARLLEGHLKAAGYAVSTRMDGTDLLSVVKELAPDAILLDGTLPSADGFDLCRDIRPHYRGVIILLTARDEVIDELLGLELGADDFIRKPVNSRVVLAHLRACLRRAEGFSAPAADAVSIRDLSISLQARRVTLAGAELALTTAEFDLLWALASRAGSIVSRDELFRSTRGLEHDGLDRSIDMRVSRLRKLLGDDSQEPKIIKTIRGKGYLFSAS